MTTIDRIVKRTYITMDIHRVHTLQYFFDVKEPYGPSELNFIKRHKENNIEC